MPEPSTFTFPSTISTPLPPPPPAVPAAPPPPSVPVPAPQPVVAAPLPPVLFAPVPPAPIAVVPAAPAPQAPPPPVVAPPLAPPAIAAPVASASVPAHEDEDVPVALGMKVSTLQVKRFKAAVGYTSRIGVLTTERIYPVKSHWVEQLRRRIVCFGTLCCEDTDPWVYYVMPIVVYDVNRDGDIISPKFEIQFFPAAGKTYDQFITMNKANRLDTVDIAVACSEAGYQNNSYTVCGPAAWRSDSNFMNAVWAKYVSIEPYIVRSFARRLGKNTVEAEKAWKRAVSSVAAEGDDSAKPPGFDMSKFASSGTT